MPILVTGYHGCHIEAVAEIISGAGFRSSENGYDWLGKGIYFWEDAPNRAAEWAKKKFGVDGVVLEATIDLGRTINLLDTVHFDRIEETYNEVLATFKQLGLSVPLNENKKHELDYLIIESYCDRATLEGGEAFQTVRGCFPEGKPLYDGSKILRETHIQVSVRDSSCISDLLVVN